MSERSMTWLAWALSVALLGVGLVVRYAPPPPEHSGSECQALPPGTLSVSFVVHPGTIAAIDVYGVQRPGTTLPGARAPFQAPVPPAPDLFPEPAAQASPDLGVPQ